MPFSIKNTRTGWIPQFLLRMCKLKWKQNNNNKKLHKNLPPILSSAFALNFIKYTSFFKESSLIRMKGWSVWNCWLFTRSERWNHICALKHCGAFQKTSEGTAYKSLFLSCLNKAQYPLKKKFINVIKKTMTKHSPLGQRKLILPQEEKEVIL